MDWKNSPRAVLAALLAVHVLAHVDRNMLLAFSPQITRELGLGNAQYGLLTGAVWVLSFGVMAVFMGSLADRFSRTRVMAVGILLWSACTAASGTAQDFGQMVLARFLVASGEAALVPAAVSLLAELFGERRRGAAMGVFFMGIPLGIGLSFLLAGTLGPAQGWRGTFSLLGLGGLAVALPLALLPDRRGAQAPGQRGEAFLPQLRAVLAVLRGSATLRQVIAGFVLVHLVFVGLSFLQLWLVHERGLDAAQIARRVGLLQIVFGVLGAAAGGTLSDGLARRMPGGHAGFMALLVACCAPLMLAARFAPAASPLFYIGLCAGFFLPLALYGPALALIQGLAPVALRSTLTGVTMLLINVLAIAIGNLVAGLAVDLLPGRGVADPLTAVLVATDLLALLAGGLFLRAARGPRVQAPAAPVVAH